MISVDRVLDDAEVSAGDVDQVLLVGGSTRIPAVWDIVVGHLGIERQMSINPEEVVALGAAAQTGIIASWPMDAILVDIRLDTKYSL